MVFKLCMKKKDLFILSFLIIFSWIQPTKVKAELTTISSDFVKVNAAAEKWWEDVQVSAFSASFAGAIAQDGPDPTAKHTEEFYLNLYSQAGVTIANWADIQAIDNWENGYLDYVTTMHEEGLIVIGTASMIRIFESPNQHLGPQEPPELLNSVINDPFGNLLLDDSLSDHDFNIVWYTHSMLHPDWQNYWISYFKSMIDMGVDGILIDEMAYGTVFEPDFNSYTMSLFRDYLFSTYSQEKIHQFESEYSISDFNNFDYSEFIKDYLPLDMDKIKSSDWQPEIWWDVPFGHDFERFKRIKNKEVAEIIFNQIRSYTKNNYDRNISVSSNLNDLSSPEALYFVDLLDYIESEIFYHENGYFPNYRGFSVVKLGQAFNKKCNLLTSVDTRSDIISRGKDLSVNLYRTMIADAYSSGGNFTVEEGFWGIELDIESLDEYFQFPMKNYDFFNNTSPMQGKVGLLFLWECLDIYQSTAYRGMSNLLSDVGFQFSVVFGAEEYNPWGEVNIYPAPNYPLKLEELNKYSTIIIPELTNLLETHANLLLRYVQNGGNLLVYSTKDNLQSIEWQWPDDEDVLTMIGHLKAGEVSLGDGKIICKNNILGTQYLVDTSLSNRNQLMATLSNLGLTPEIALSEDRNVLASNTFYGDNMLMINFVNYNHNSETDFTTSTQSVPISISLPDDMESDNLIVFFAEPGKDSVELDYTTSDGLLNLNLPEIHIWGILIIQKDGSPAWAGLIQNQISELYVSIFNRASEGEGNAYWRSQPDMATAATAMLATQAAQNYFGNSLNSNQAFIEHIYLNTLNKTIADDFDGINYWVGMLDAGTSRGQAVAKLVGAINDYAPNGPYYNPDDTATVAAYNQFTNRVEVSDYMADNVWNIPDDWETSTSFSHGMVVTDDPGTVWAAKANVDLFK